MKFNWPAESIWEQIQPVWPDFTIDIVSQTDSTNTQLLQRIRSGQTAPVMLVAETQTAGRGRMGKAWASQAGDTLMFSLAAPLNPEQHGLSLVLGCAVINALDTIGQKLKIKWPNDIWYAQPDPNTGQNLWHKLVGILVETVLYGRQRYAVIGIGININPPPQQSTYHTPPGYLKQLDPRWDAPSALACVAPHVAQAVYNFNTHGLAPWQQSFAQKDLLAGNRLYISNGIQGTGAGIDLHGNLLIKTADGLKTISSGEVSVRPC